MFNNIKNKGKRKISITLLYGKICINRSILQIKDKINLADYNLNSKEIISFDEFLNISNLPFKISKEMMIEMVFCGQNQPSFNDAKMLLEKYKDIKLPTGVVNLVTYIKNNINKMDYRKYEKNNWFVGGGAIESSNKIIVQRRLKQAGMRWSVKGAQYLLALPSKFESMLWETEVRKRILAIC